MQAAVDAFLQERTPGARIPFRSSDLVPFVVEGLRTLRADVDEGRESPYVWQAHHPTDDEPEDGLIIRDAPGKDPKTYWQWRPRTFHMLRSGGARFSPERTAWIVACQQLHRRCAEHALAFASALEAARPGWRVRDQMAAFGQHVLRVLLYDPVPGTVAKRHVDKCFLTLHFAENREGLEVWDQPVRDLADQAVVFPGLKAELATGGRIRAAEHCVRQPPDARGPRWVLVFFAHTGLVLPKNVVTCR